MKPAQLVRFLQIYPTARGDRYGHLLEEMAISSTSRNRRMKSRQGTAEMHTVLTKLQGVLPAVVTQYSENSYEDAAANR